jgi:hypothetical protein
LWKRKEFKDFKYLGVRLSPGRKVLVGSVTAFFCLLILTITCFIAIGNRDHKPNARDYNGYGYVLLDRYLLNTPTTE